MASLSGRLLVAASVVLAGFLGLTGLALDRAFRDSALEAVQDRLQAQVYMLLGAAGFDPVSRRLLLPEALPEARFSSPGSGLYAAVFDETGALLWRSPSMLGMEIPFPVPRLPGQGYFEQVFSSDAAPLLTLGFAVSWEVEPGVYRGYRFGVAEHRRTFDAQLGGFRQGLWGWLAASALMLLVVQGAILRWGLRPLRRVARELTDIEAGRRDQLTGSYPRELRRLTENLNALIRQNQTHLERYRNALGDLAHSLKTPLAVLRGTVADANTSEDLRRQVAEQVERMNRTVDYQLQRAAASGRVALASPLAVPPLANRIISALAKVYVGKQLTLDVQVDEQARFQGDEGDFMEIFGNLADNACKWAVQRVTVRARPVGEGLGLLLEVEDDGPGIPEDRRRLILDRGARADPATPGHGIGLAVVRELVEEVYRGRLEIDRSVLGGARVTVRLRF